VTTAQPSVRGGLTYRPVRADELAACADIWRVAINDYIARLNQPDLAVDTAPLVRLYQHLHATDPDRFVVACRADPDADGGERLVGFAVAVVRQWLWFLSMCFVLPGEQGGGVGRALLDRVGLTSSSDVVARATGTDSAQPISNALYASLGMVPRIPLLNLVGTPERPAAFGDLPSGITATPFERLATADHGRLVDAVDAIDRETLGVAHPADHRYLRGEGRRGWLFAGPDGAPLAYGYATEAGRVGPVATRDADLVAPILGYLMTEVVPRGAFAVWLPGDASAAVVAALQAGLRLEPFPVLLCWDRPFADFSRYAPISPGLL
jgi:hypothetical protein